MDREQEQLKSLSARSWRIIAKGAGHGVHHYRPELAAPDNPFSRNCVDNNNCVGQELQITYDPSGAADPVGDMVHWIQVVYTNFDGTPAYQIDNGGSDDGPYYDISGAANPSGFLDIPGIADAGNLHFFDAELYLVSGPAAGSPGAVTIYGEIDWGWQNSPTLEPSTYLLAAVGLGFIGWRRRSSQGKRAAPSPVADAEPQANP